MNKVLKEGKVPENIQQGTALQSNIVKARWEW